MGTMRGTVKLLLVHGLLRKAMTFTIFKKIWELMTAKERHH